MTTPKTTLPEWDALSAARRAVLDARTNVARAAFDAATKARRKPQTEQLSCGPVLRQPARDGSTHNCQPDDGAGWGGIKQARLHLANGHAEHRARWWSAEVMVRQSEPFAHRSGVWLLTKADHASILPACASSHPSPSGGRSRIAWAGIHRSA